MANTRTLSNIRVDNVKATIKAINEFAPDLKKRMTKEIRDSLNVVKTRAEGKYPKGAWQVQINNRRILGSIKTRAGSTSYGQRWGDADPGVRAAIFEFAGTRTAGDTPQAKGMIESLTRRYGQPGRFLWAAWDEVGPAALEQIRDAVKKAERELQNRLNETGDSF
jgi:hypothetical protein